MVRQFLASPTLPVKFYLDAGTFEMDSAGEGGDILEASRHLRDVLRAKGRGPLSAVRGWPRRPELARHARRRPDRVARFEAVTVHGVAAVVTPRFGDRSERRRDRGSCSCSSVKCGVSYACLNKRSHRSYSRRIVFMDTNLTSGRTVVMRVLSCCAVPLVLVCAHGVLVFGSESLRAAQQSESSFPPLLDAYLTAHVHLTPAERKTLLSNAPVTKLLEADPSKEVSVFGAVWIDAAAVDYVRLMEDIERFEHGGRFRITREIQRALRHGSTTSRSSDSPKKT